MRRQPAKARKAINNQLAAIAFSAIVFAPAAHAQCLDYEKAAKTLATKHQESMLFRGWGQAAKGRPAREIVEIWASSRSWTVLRLQIMRVGNAYVECASMTSSGGTWEGQAMPGFGLPGPF